MMLNQTQYKKQQVKSGTQNDFLKQLCMTGQGFKKQENKFKPYHRSTKRFSKRQLNA